MHSEITQNGEGTIHTSICTEFTQSHVFMHRDIHLLDSMFVYGPNPVKSTEYPVFTTESGFHSVAEHGYPFFDHYKKIQ